MASREVVVRKKVGAEEQLDRLPCYVSWDSLFHLMELFHGLIVFCLCNGQGWLGTLITCQLVCCTHSVGVMHGMTDVTGPFIFRAVLKVDGNVSWRDSGGATRLN